VDTPQIHTLSDRLPNQYSPVTLSYNASDVSFLFVFLIDWFTRSFTCWFAEELANPQILNVFVIFNFLYLIMYPFRMLIIKHNAKFVNRLLMFSALCLFFRVYFCALCTGILNF